MAMFRVIEAVDAASVDAARATLVGNPRNKTHLKIESVTRWTIRLNGRNRRPA